MRLTDAVALGAGALLALVTDNYARKISPASQLVPAAAAGLVTAAAIYPAARAGRPAASSVARRENLAVLATGAVMAVAVAKRGNTAVRRVVAVGWLAHAIFDNVHDKGPTSRLPDWYPAACAGYDVALAGLLLRA